MPLDKGAASKAILANLGSKVTNDIARGEDLPAIDDSLRTALRQIRKAMLSPTPKLTRGSAASVFRSSVPTIPLKAA